MTDLERLVCWAWYERTPSGGWRFSLRQIGHRYEITQYRLTQIAKTWGLSRYTTNRKAA